MRKLSADYVYPITQSPIENGVLVLDDQGKVLSVDKLDAHDPASVETFSGILIPGLINTHCHLELSHMKGLLDTGTGLISFLQKVVAFRDFPMEEILEAIEKGDREMYDEGIVAVGDISNKLDTFQTKASSPIRYYSFVEMFDFIQDRNAQASFDQFVEVFYGQSEDHGNKKSCVPHAPYTVSPTLFSLINAINQSKGTVSIHNQETVHENNFFLDKTGDFLSFYQHFGLPLDHLNPTGQTSIHYAMAHMDPACRTLFVHNTTTSAADIRTAQAWNDQVYWATCPNANLYIENQLPNYQHFIDTAAKVTIGTDSLTSNWQLSVLAEMKTIARYQSYVSLDLLLKWATINGAEALGYEADLGSFEVGKTPGVNLLSLQPGQKNIDQDTAIRRLA